MRRKVAWLVSGLAVALGGIVLVSHFALAGPKVHVGRPCSGTDRVSFDQVDHQSFDALLGKYVDAKGMVAYAAWKANAQDAKALDDYLIRLGCVDRGKPASKAGQLAYWINAYNAVTLKGILREHPTSSIRNHTAKLGGYNIWKDLLLTVDGKSYSLDDIEHAILRKMGEPRIHFALVCASIGCPPLANQAYTAGNLDSQLNWNARRFFANPANFRADAGARTVYISQLLQWYGTDFAPTAAGQARLLRPYFPSGDTLSWLDSDGFAVKYLVYDWNLNDQHKHR